eukprot:m.68018 g.68018  ORF g.68018 m.68018 type:complete len:703 (+) comp11932_c0_seq1:464-2572(+)
MGCASSKQDPSVLCEGYLKKKKAKKGFARYYTVLKGGRLHFFKSKSQDARKKAGHVDIALDDPVVAGPHKKGRYVFYVKGAASDYALMVPTERDRIRWISKINECSAKMRDRARRMEEAERRKQEASNPKSNSIKTTKEGTLQRKASVESILPPVPERQEVKRELTQLDIDAQDEPWFAGDYSKKHCDWAVRTLDVGAFLIRRGPRSTYVLSLRDESKMEEGVTNYVIRIVSEGVEFAGKKLPRLRDIVEMLAEKPLKSDTSSRALRLEIPAGLLARQLAEADGPEAAARVMANARSGSIVKMKGTKHILEFEEADFDFRGKERLGGGQYGDVYRGTVKGKVAAIKVAKVNPAELGRAEQDMMLEISTMKKVHDCGMHPNVIKLIGFMSHTSTHNPILALELAEHGDLKGVCRGLRHQPTPVWNAYIARFSNQIANAMSFLETHNFVHRDLACRNVLVATNLVCKVSDFGLARDVYTNANKGMYVANQGYVNHQSNPTAWKWTALEGIRDEVWTSSSDVWSFGVVLAELCSRGAEPYPGFKGGPQMMLNFLLDGNRMEMGPSWPKKVCTLMKACWQQDPSTRPSFNQLVGQTNQFIKAFGQVPSSDLKNFVRQDSIHSISSASSSRTSSSRRARPSQSGYNHMVHTKVLTLTPEPDYGGSGSHRQSQHGYKHMKHTKQLDTDLKYQDEGGYERAFEEGEITI